MGVWEKGVKEVHRPEFDYILEEIARLFEIEQRKLKNPTKKKSIKKNLELIRIYLPKKDFENLENLSLFKELHNLGGIPVSKINEENIRIDVEVSNPKKRKRKTIIYVREER